MKYKVTALAILALMIYSCASKSNAPAAASTPVATSGTRESTATVMTPELAQGKELYDNNCAKCHRLYGPKEYSAEEWKPIVDRMQKKAHLDDMQGQKIYNYLTMN
ncbi:c-type cytochrome [Flavobacterium wongokense]|uniref:c-type cytochrome n=1 Tax=Flavobacterium wongokense TaxID=2910674 RepID=UPI001F324B4A|nr:c-type cytochrome [Flavobacterium sp. WG47]MCF6132925.1 c-type cytochrome [Flavobacterium sp. WG47]